MADGMLITALPVRFRAANCDANARLRNGQAVSSSKCPAQVGQLFRGLTEIYIC